MTVGKIPQNTTYINVIIHRGASFERFFSILETIKRPIPNNTTNGNSLNISTLQIDS